MIKPNAIESKRVVVGSLGRKPSPVRRQYRSDLGYHEIRVALRGLTDYTSVAEEVLAVEKVLRPDVQPLPDICDHFANSFRLFSEGSVRGAFEISWSRDVSTSDIPNVSTDLVVTVRRI